MKVHASLLMMATTAFCRPEGSLDDLMAAARRTPVMNCLDLVLAGQGFLKTRSRPSPPCSSTSNFPGISPT